MIIYLCIKFESNTLIFSKDIKWKPFLLHTDRTDIRTDSSDTICTPPPPLENGGGGGGGDIKKISLVEKSALAGAMIILLPADVQYST